MSVVRAVILTCGVVYVAPGVSAQPQFIRGDYNADCGGFDENDTSHPLKDPRFHWIITNDMDADVDARRDCARDRIILVADTLNHEYIPTSADVFPIDTEYGISRGIVRALSDHYPVYARFSISLPDDD